MFKPMGKLMAGALLMAVALLQPVLAGGGQKVKWTDLVPKLAPLNNPLLDLPDDQREAFDNISFYQSFNASIMDQESMADYRDAKRIATESRRELEKQNVDVDDLFDRHRKWQNEVERRNSLTNKKFDGKVISVAGYLLPLDFADRGVRDFLLVPYVGACIHSPPPPINQTVFVRMNKAYKVNGLYDPVWVTGRMSTQRVSKKLTLVDGNNFIDAGYSLTGKNIRKYNRPK